MALPIESIDAPIAPVQLAARWQALCANSSFEDVAGKIELTEWAEIFMTPVGKSHGRAAMRVADALRKALGGHVMAEVGVSTSIGVRAPGGTAALERARVVCGDRISQQRTAETQREGGRVREGGGDGNVAGVFVDLDRLLDKCFLQGGTETRSFFS